MLMDFVIKIQPRMKSLDKEEYCKIKEYSKKLLVKYDSMEDLRHNIVVLYTYQLQGLCWVRWDHWNIISRTQANKMLEESEKFIDEIRELNPAITAQIDDMFGWDSKIAGKPKLCRNLLQNIIKIQSCRTFEKGSVEYEKQFQLANKVIKKFDSSKDLRINMYLLYIYQKKGMCLIDCEKWYSIPKEETKNLFYCSQAYINEISELNPETTGKIEEFLNIKKTLRGKSDKRVPTEIFDYIDKL